VAVLEAILTAFVIAGALPLVAGCYQFALAGLHRFRHRATGTLEREPNVAVIVPAWNEAAVIGRTIDTLLALDYPAERLRVYVVDDASTDATPDVVLAKAAAHPGRVQHLRRAHGGEGKAHTLNHGLRKIRAEGWYEAVLIIDADVIFTARSLRRMVRHLGDPEVGAVTAYIKEGSRPANSMNRFVAYEYIAAQAGARRAQNVLGAQACLAGGAQLLRRESLEAIGGEIDTSSLAEDTFTTFNVQLSGRRVVFEPHAIVWAEEPRDIAGLWKQRLRWGRGNVQVTLRYRRCWLRRSAGKLGGVSFALIWFSVFLMPALMVLSSASLVILFALRQALSLDVFRSLWALNLVTHLFVTASAFAQDGPAARASWREAIAFPGLISLAIIVCAIYPGLASGLPDWLLLFVYVWLSASMLAAYLLRRLETVPHAGGLARLLLYVVGYGPLLCAITAAAYVAELRHAEMAWEKTEKTGAVGDLA
jgi:cellulose synthase/poly-beta-1,6-N-acetylglucosamine synthase-like glycosyltransferase